MFYCIWSVACFLLHNALLGCMCAWYRLNASRPCFGGMVASVLPDLSSWWLFSRAKCQLFQFLHSWSVGLVDYTFSRLILISCSSGVILANPLFSVCCIRSSSWCWHWCLDDTAECTGVPNWILADVLIFLNMCSVIEFGSLCSVHPQIMNCTLL